MDERIRSIDTRHPTTVDLSLTQVDDNEFNEPGRLAVRPAILRAPTARTLPGAMLLVLCIVKVTWSNLVEVMVYGDAGGRPRAHEFQRRDRHGRAVSCQPMRRTFRPILHSRSVYAEPIRTTYCRLTLRPKDHVVRAPVRTCQSSVRLWSLGLFSSKRRAREWIRMNRHEMSAGGHDDDR